MDSFFRGQACRVPLRLGPAVSGDWGWGKQEELLLAVFHVLVLSLLRWVDESLVCGCEVVPKLNTDY